ncbi:alcohol dehydrogenase catalytic domain-containing protein [Leptolyngbya sp. NIES-2104]|uniref:alcohol dehydrogenase catalytic domain-containing protein n=1 Tax=Leptolyngbya sp. NIES-2104 TaxID=1552121 RepID=UPI0006ECA122|nr:alcohol dehydrogenase catalytic domain-containing protein [Leptolyngbya sp. NIES-2104]GAP99989.1 zinc-containing alcohol dehydrogenase, NADPH:quinone reductase [Leptolyngbya sp. NIES-2104]
MPPPEVLPNHVLIRVKATSVNPVDCKIRQGAVPDISPEFPAILHGDVAGVVEAVGEGVQRFSVGDEVYGCAGGVRGMGGTLAEFMLADADLIAKKPRSLGMREAAALPLVAITAWEGLRDRTSIQSVRVFWSMVAQGVWLTWGCNLRNWRVQRSLQQFHRMRKPTRKKLGGRCYHQLPKATR